jgi:hypothetical protein
MPVRMECAPAFDYARAAHTTNLVPDNSIQQSLSGASPASAGPKQSAQLKALFSSADAGLRLDLRYVAEATSDAAAFGVPPPVVELNRLDLSGRGHKGPGVYAELNLVEGQAVTFVLRTPPTDEEAHLTPSEGLARETGIPLEQLIHSKTKLRAQDDPLLTPVRPSFLYSNFRYLSMMTSPRNCCEPSSSYAVPSNFLCYLSLYALQSTNDYWLAWIRKSSYKGSWKESVLRSALALKLLIFEPTGAVVASPTFSLPEYIGGTRNWDYRASWIRDASFTLYALLRLGFTYEANGKHLAFVPHAIQISIEANRVAYVEFILDRLKDKNPDGSLQIM